MSERETLTWELFGTAGHVADVRCAVVYEKPHSTVNSEYVWRRTPLWINFPWSTLPPVVSREGQVLDA